MVATSVLNAHDRFALPVFAPALNNVVVTASYGLFWLLPRTAGPVAAPVRAPRSSCSPAAPRSAWSRSARCRASPSSAATSGSGPTSTATIPRSAASVAWARGPRCSSPSPSCCCVVVLVLANRVEGGVVAYQVGFTFFLLPHALFALPVLTASFPTLSRQAAAQRLGRVQPLDRAGHPGHRVLRAAGGGRPHRAGRLLARSVLFGQTGRAGAAQVAGVLVGLRPGPVRLRACSCSSAGCIYARDDTRTPALVNVGVAVRRGRHGGGVHRGARHAARAGARPGPLGRVHRRRRRAVPPRAGERPARPAIGRMCCARSPRRRRGSRLAGAVMWAIAQVADPVSAAGRPRACWSSAERASGRRCTSASRRCSAVLDPRAVVAHASREAVVAERAIGGLRRTVAGGCCSSSGPSTGGIRRHVAALADGPRRAGLGRSRSPDRPA